MKVTSNLYLVPSIRMSKVVSLLSCVCLHGIDRDFIYVYILFFWLYKKISFKAQDTV